MAKPQLTVVLAMRLPPGAMLHVRSLLDLPDESQKAFLEALKDADTDFNVYDLANYVLRSTGLPRSLVIGFIQGLAQVYLAKDRYPESLEKFLDKEISTDLKSQLAAELPKASPEEIEAYWNKLRVFLGGALTLDKTLGTAAKAGPVMTDHERIFVDARVLSDVRFIFHPDLSEKPDGSAIVHMLRITTRDIYNNHNTEHFALDSNDVRFMKQLMDRAIKKEETIIKAMEPTGIKVLTPKGLF